MNPETPQPRQSTLRPFRHLLWWLLLPLVVLIDRLFLRPPAPLVTGNAVSIATPAATTSLDDGMTVSPTRSATAKPIQLVLFVPDDNGRLQRKSVPSNLPPFNAGELTDAGQLEKVQAKAATLALERLMQQSPADFPNGAKMRAPIVLKNGVAHVDFNSNFADPDFWQGSARILASTQAIAQTVSGTMKPLGEAPKGGVQLMIDGKPLDVLGDLDVSEPIQPDNKMVGGA
jgi:hypothetical protein